MTPQQLAAIHLAAFSVAGSDGTSRPWSAREFEDLLRSPSIVLCAARDGAPGFVLGRVAGGEAEVLTVAVHPDAQRTGLGRGVLEAFLAVAIARGADTAFLEVAEDNTAARALYRTAGFDEVARRKAYYVRSGGRRQDAILLRHTLSA